MGADSKKPPLPAPTESDSTAGASELATDISKATDKTSYSIPEDGSPITISTRRKREKEGDGKISQGSHPSQTSLLIEYFEAGKEGKSGGQRPSVRVRVTPSSHRKSKSNSDHIQITESKGNRKPSYTKRISLNNFKDDQEAYEKSLSEATGSNATSNGGGPIEIEVAPRRHGSPLIPSDVNNSTYVQEQNVSDVSSLPANSFLDGGPSTQSPRRKRSKSLSKGEALAAGAAAGLATAVVVDSLKAPERSGSRSRSLSKERIAQKAAEKIKNDQQSEKRRRHSKSRARSVSGEKEPEGARTPRRRSSRNHNVEESLISGTDSSLLSSQVAPSQQSYRSGTSKSSINNPKLLETVEDAIRRLIIPELTAIKREQSKNAQRRDRDRERRGSITSGSGVSRDSREERSERPKVTLNGKEVDDDSLKDRRETGDRESAVSSERSFEREASEETVTPGRDRKKRSSSDRHRGIEALAAGGAIGALTAAALHRHDSKENIDDTRERRRRRNKGHSPGASLGENVDDKLAPPMPMMSDINSSEITRTSIQSAETERPLSASEEHLGTPIYEVPRRTAANVYDSHDSHDSPSSPSSGTPTRTPVAFRQGLGTQHTNYSRGDLSLRSQNSEHQLQSDEYEVDEHGRKVPVYQDDEEYYEEDEHQARSHTTEAGLLGAAAGAGLAALHHDNEEQSPIFSPYASYQPPHPLKYVPYAQENRRGLSPIQSVSSWREDEDPNHRDSGLAHSVRSYSSFDKQSQLQRGSVASYNSLDSARSPGQDNRHDFAEVREGGLADSELTQDTHEREYWEEQQRMNASNQEFDAGSYRDSYPYSDRASSGQNVRGGAGNNIHVHTPVGVESAVASIVSASNQSGQSGYQRQIDRKVSNASFEEGSERNFTSRGNSPVKQDTYHETRHEESRSRGVNSPRSSPNKYAPEYELDEDGRKVTMPSYRRSDVLGAGAIGAAAGMAAGALAGRKSHDEVQERREYETRPYGSPQNKTFKERAMEHIALAKGGSSQGSLNRSVGEGEDHIPIKMSATGVPDVHDPMPEIGYGDAESEVTTNPSIIHGPIGGTQHGSRDHWPGTESPPMTAYDRPRSAISRDDMVKAAEAGLVGAAAGAGLAAAENFQARERGNDHDDEWRRTSEECKRDTLVTNPYEDMPLSHERTEHFENHAFDNHNVSSPLGAMKDEGYISSAPNGRSPDSRTPERRSKGTGLLDQGSEEASGGDPFYTPKNPRHLSSVSEGLNSPLYEGATGNGMDRIKNQDIIALMEHLTVRDAQRHARDTEILITLVRAAAENRVSATENRDQSRSQFADLRKLLEETVADSEDIIIKEVQRNTDRSVQKVMGGSRPVPSSTPRSLRSQDMNEDVPTKRRNIFKRALKGLGVKSTNDLGKVEDILMQILGDVEELKRAQGLSPQTQRAGSRADSYNDIQEGAYEQDRGYEPEGHAGTSSASHASQSGYFSNPHSRGASAVRFDIRKDFSDHRISTVPEGDEDELDEHEQTVLENQFENNEALLTPTREIPRGASAPLNTPPQVYVPQASNSNENTPKTDKSKKHKSSSSSGWLPKISRWSETTASTVAKGFRSSRSSKQREDERPTSKSGSDGGSFDGQDNGPWVADKLHTGFSQENLVQNDENAPVGSMLPPEDPKYKAHRNSLNLQHPQPRPGPTVRYQTALEVQAQDFGHPQSPKSVDWGSNTSLNRLPQINNNRYSNGTAGNLSPISDGIPYSPTSMHSPNHPQTSPAPPRPPKEPLTVNTGPERPPKIRNKLSKPSPLNNQLSNQHLSAENIEQYGGSNTNLSPVYNESVGSPRDMGTERRPSALGGVPARKPTGPRSMSTASRSGELNRDNGTVVRRNVNRDTFGTIAGSHHSGESEIF